MEPGPYRLSEGDFVACLCNLLKIRAKRGILYAITSGKRVDSGKDTKRYL
jgi:hypothetical protein